MSERNFQPPKRKTKPNKKKLESEQWGEVKFVPKVPKHSNPFSGNPKIEHETTNPTASWNNFKGDFDGKEQQRGNSKFTPNKFKGDFDGKQHQRGNSKFTPNKFKGGFVGKQQQRGNSNFSPKGSTFSRPPRECTNTATPWKTFKDDLEEKQREDQNSNAIDMNSTDAQKMLKEREQNFRRNLITSQAKEPTQWEIFEDDKTAVTSVAKNRIELLKDIDLKNFKSTDLNFKQNNTFRKLLTKGIQMSDNKSTLEDAIKDMKNQKKKAEAFTKIRNKAKALKKDKNKAKALRRKQNKEKLH